MTWHVSSSWSAAYAAGELAGRPRRVLRSARHDVRRVSRAVNAQVAPSASRHLERVEDEVDMPATQLDRAGAGGAGYVRQRCAAGRCGTVPARVLAAVPGCCPGVRGLGEQLQARWHDALPDPRTYRSGARGGRLVRSLGRPDVRSVDRWPVPNDAPGAASSTAVVAASGAAGASGFALRARWRCRGAGCCRALRSCRSPSWSSRWFTLPLAAAVGGCLSMHCLCFPPWSPTATSRACCSRRHCSGRRWHFQLAAVPF